jgi:hypothetical protein
LVKNWQSGDHGFDPRQLESGSSVFMVRASSAVKHRASLCFPYCRLWFANSFKAANRFNANSRTLIGVAFLIENRQHTSIQIAEVALVQHVMWEGK